MVQTRDMVALPITVLMLARLYARRSNKRFGFGMDSYQRTLMLVVDPPSLSGYVGSLDLLHQWCQQMVGFIWEETPRISNTF